MSEEIGLKEFKALTNELIDLRETKEKMEENLSQVNKLIDEINQKLIAYMEEAQIDNFQTDRGKFVLSEHFSVRIPREPNDVEAFLAHVKERGDLDAVLKINSQSLNAWYKREMEAYNEKHDDFNFSVPGIEKPEVYQRISFRSRK